MHILFKKLRILSTIIAMLATTLPTVPALAAPELLRLPEGITVSPSEFLPLDTTGNQNYPEAQITARQAQILYPFGLASHMAHSYKLNRSNPIDHHWNFDRLNFLELTPLDTQLIPTTTFELFNPKTGRFEHEASGLQARGLLHKPSNTLILGFAGTDFDLGQRSRATLYSSTLIAWNYQNPMLNEAAQLCQQLLESDQYDQIILTGSSLGGAVAQYAAIACDLPVVAFNSLALSKELRTNAINFGAQMTYELDKTLEEHKDNLILAKIKGEFLNNNKWLGGYALQNPHPVGVPSYIIPPANKKLNMLKRHWTPAVVAGLEKMAGYHFPLWTKEREQEL